MVGFVDQRHTTFAYLLLDKVGSKSFPKQWIVFHTITPFSPLSGNGIVSILRNVAATPRNVCCIGRTCKRERCGPLTAIFGYSDGYSFTAARRQRIACRLEGNIRYTTAEGFPAQTHAL